MAIDVPGIYAARDELVAANELLQQWEIGFDTLNLEFAQRPVGAGRQFRERQVGSGDDKLRQQRVRSGMDRCAGITGRLDANAPCRRTD